MTREFVGSKQQSGQMTSMLGIYKTMENP